MTHQLVLELGDEIFQPLVQAARQAGHTPEEWAATQLGLCALSAAPATQEGQAALARLLALQLPVADWDQMEEEIIRGVAE